MGDNITLNVILYACGAITALAAAGAVIVKIVKHTITSVSKQVTQQVSDVLEKKFLDRIDEVNRTLCEMIETNRQQDAETRRLSVKNAASRIFEAHNYYMERGNISSLALSNLRELFESYHRQGGNGYAALCMEQIEKLPVIDHMSE